MGLRRPPWLLPGREGAGRAGARPGSCSWMVPMGLGDLGSWVGGREDLRVGV